MTRSQAVALPNPSTHALDRLSVALQLIEAVDTIDGALDLSNQVRALAAAVRAANLSLEAQNEAARLRLTAERKLGELLIGADVRRHRHHGVTLPEGVTGSRSSRAQKLARIPEGEWESWISNTLSAGKELTHAGALRIAPVTRREERKAIADTYAAPPIDVSLAREWGLAASDDRADLLTTAIRDALRDLTKANPRHAYVWAKYHGIADDGTIGDSWTFDAIAGVNGWSREYVGGLYYRASHHVRGSIVAAAFAELADMMAAG